MSLFTTVRVLHFHGINKFGNYNIIRELYVYIFVQLSIIISFLFKI